MRTLRVRAGPFALFEVGKRLYMRASATEESAMLNRRWIFAVMFWLWAGRGCGWAADAAAHFSVDVWPAELDSLPQQEVIAMTQTRDGYLWLGTLNGLARFDGLRFTVFNEVNAPGLGDNQIVHLFEDSRSNLWVGTMRNGVVLFKDGHAHALGIGSGGREKRLVSACEDATGAVWLYTADGQLVRYQDGKMNAWRINAGSDRFSNCRAMIAEKSGLIWVGTDRRMFGINPKADLGPDLAVEKILEVPEGLEFLLAREHGGYWRVSGGRVQKWTGTHMEKDLGPSPWNPRLIFAACEDQEGNLIAGTLGDGVWWFDLSGRAEHLTSGEHGLSHDYILSLTMDREGSLWAGTDGGGLDRVKRQTFTVLPGTEALDVQSACEDGQGGVWLNSHGGVRLWKDGALKTYGAEQGLQNTNGQVIFVDRQQNLWAGSFGPSGPGLFRLHDDRFEVEANYAAKNNPEISVLFQDRKEQLWVGTQGGLAVYDGNQWRIFTTRNGLSSDAVQAVAEVPDGSLWIGTGNGLNHFQDGQFKVYHTKDGLPGEDVSAVYVDADGVVWVATHGRGLGRFFAGKWTVYTRDQGLLSDSVGYLIEDGQENLWMGSPVGLMRVRKSELKDVADGRAKSFSCRAYSKADGLLAGECTTGSQPGACRTRDGRLWFPTIRGLVSVDPAQIRFNTNPPPVVIESVTLDDESDQTNVINGRLPGEITVPAGNERVEIRFTSLNLSAPKGSRTQARFKYRMEGHETAWNEVDASTRTVRYARLPPGPYTFHVKACNEDGVWNQTGASLAFVVKPQFWQTWWFRIGATVCILGLIVAIVQFFYAQRLQRQMEGIRQQQALEKERARIARDLHDQLGASMTQVSLLGEMVESDKNDAAEVAEHARQISQTARDTSKVLDEIVWTVNPSNDTLEGLVNYICKYAQEYFAVANVRYRLDVPAQLPDVEISPEVRHNVFLAAKEAVTNVVRHAKASEVWLRLRLEPGRFVLELQDNGRGPSGSEGKSTRNGLRNMHKRMEDVGGSFALSAAPEGGALVRLTAPINNQ